MQQSTDPSRGIRALTFAFILSQFFRTCLAVIAPELQRDLGLSPAGFGALSSCFFMAFAVAQIPVGIAFDRYGVGAPTRLLSAVGVAASVLFVVAPGGATAMVAQAGLGLACAPVFMGLMHFASEQLPPQRYASVIGRANAVSMLGALCATAPLGWAAHHIGWRPALGVAAVCMLLACIAVWRDVRDTGHADARDQSPGVLFLGSVRLLALPPMWTLIPLCVALAAGTTFRNAWGGPYLADVFGLDAGARGLSLALVSLGGFVAALLLPVLVRRFSIKATILGWSVFSMTCGLLLSLWPAAGLAPGGAAADAAGHHRHGASDGDGARSRPGAAGAARTRPGRAEHLRLPRIGTDVVDLRPDRGCEPSQRLGRRADLCRDLPCRDARRAGGRSGVCAEPPAGAAVSRCSRASLKSGTLPLYNSEGDWMSGMLVGGCRCGSIRYQVRGEPMYTSLCHCTDCRKSAGAPMVAWAAYQESSFLILCGVPRTFNGSGSSYRSFCAECGTGLFFRNPEALPGLVDIQIATLDEPDVVPPQIHIQTAERLHWMNRLADLPQFDRYPKESGG